MVCQLPDSSRPAPVKSNEQDPVALDPCSLDLFEFVHAQRKGFLTEDVLPGAQCFDYQSRMTIVRGRDHHRVDIRVSENLLGLHRAVERESLGYLLCRQSGSRSHRHEAIDTGLLE